MLGGVEGALPIAVGTESVKPRRTLATGWRGQVEMVGAVLGMMLDIRVGVVGKQLHLAFGLQVNQEST